MKLTAITVTDFKSIRDSNRVEIGDVTCLVGKNESGKTTLLQALYRLNPIIESDGVFDVTDDYPRADVEDYQYAIEQGDRDHVMVIKGEYTLDDDEVSAIGNRSRAGIGLFVMREI